jgi:hypothetical protein
MTLRFSPFKDSDSHAEQRIMAFGIITLGKHSGFFLIAPFDA